MWILDSGSWSGCLECVKNWSLHSSELRFKIHTSPFKELGIQPFVLKSRASNRTVRENLIRIRAICWKVMEFADLIRLNTLKTREYFLFFFKMMMDKSLLIVPRPSSRCSILFWKLPMGLWKYDMNWKNLFSCSLRHHQSMKIEIWHDGQGSIHVDVRDFTLQSNLWDALGIPLVTAFWLKRLQRSKNRIGTYFSIDETVSAMIIHVYDDKS